MKFRKEIFLALIVFLSFTVVKAQSFRSTPISPVIEDDIFACRYDFSLIALNVSVRSNNGLDIKDLTYKDFDVYKGKNRLEMAFLQFEKSTNRYTLGFFEENFLGNDKQRNINFEKLNIKISLSEEKRKHLGKVFVEIQKPKRNQK